MSAARNYIQLARNLCMFRVKFNRSVDMMLNHSLPDIMIPAVTLICATYAFYAHYRRQTHGLLSIIWREGGMYYFAAIGT